MKKFKELVEEIAADQKPPKGQKKPDKYLKPVSKGEQDFVDQHSVDKKDYPVPSDDQFTGNRKGAKRTDDEEGGKVKVAGEKKPLKTYKSMTGGGSSKRSADKSQGDMKPVMQGSSKVTEGFEFIEEAFKKGMLKLKSGETVKVDEAAAKALNNAMSSLNSSNKKRMTAEAMKDKKSFMGIVKFAKSTM